MAVPFLRREPREYVSILKGVAGGAETAPALATILHGTTSRSSNPHCNPNEYRSPFPHPVASVIPLDPLSSPFPFSPVISSSLHRNTDRAFDQLKRSTITWFQRSVRRYVFLFGLFLFLRVLLACPFLLTYSLSSLFFSYLHLLSRYTFSCPLSVSLLYSLFSPRYSSVWFSEILAYDITQKTFGPRAWTVQREREREKGWENYND